MCASFAGTEDARASGGIAASVGIVDDAHSGYVPLLTPSRRLLGYQKRLIDQVP